MYNENKIVIFDWGGVVLCNLEGEFNNRMAIADTINSLSKNKYSTEKAFEIWKKCKHCKNGKYITECNDKYEIEDWYESLKKNFNIDCDYAKFYEVYNDAHKKVKYYNDVVEFAHSLKKICKIGILSNLSVFDKESIDRHYNLSKFDFVWLSFELKCRKPNEEIYKIVEEQSKISGKNILFIDDAEKNIMIAKKRNWNVCLATGNELNKIEKCVEEFLKK